MFTVLYILIALGALLALATGVNALRAGLRFRRARKTLQDQVVEDLSYLTARTGELESSLAGLEARARQLPVKVSRLQRNIATLRLLTSALGESLRQMQRLLSVARLKDTGSARLAGLVFPPLESYVSRFSSRKRRQPRG